MMAEVRVWGRTVGAVSMEGRQDYAEVQYGPEFAGGGIEHSPAVMSLREPRSSR